MAKFVGKFRRERDYEDDSRNKKNFERKKRQKQTQNAKRMSLYETTVQESSQSYELTQRVA